MTTTPKQRRPLPPEGYKYDETRVRAAIAILSNHPPFAEFMSLLRSLREDAMLYAAHHTAVESERETLVALGAFRTFDNIISTYEAQLQAAEEELRQDQEQKAREQEQPS